MIHPPTDVDIISGGLLEGGSEVGGDLLDGAEEAGPPGAS